MGNFVGHSSSLERHVLFECPLRYSTWLFPRSPDEMNDGIADVLIERASSVYPIDNVKPCSNDIFTCFKKSYKTFESMSHSNMLN